MKEAAYFYEDFLIEGPGGKYVFSPSYSPENNPGNNPSQACVNATMDIAVAKELLTNLIAACTELQTDADGVARWKKMLAKMPEYAINTDGAVKEWSMPDLEDNYAHRHCSHLYALFDGMPPEIAGNPPLQKAFLRAAERRMEVRRREGGGIMAFGLVQLGLAVSSLHEPEMSYDVVDWLANNFWDANLVTTHNPKSLFNVDLCGGLPAVVIKMLVNSRPGELELLPALPRQWAAGKIEGIRCRGQILVQSLAWKDRTVTVALRSAVPQKIVLRTGGGIRSLEIKSGDAAVEKETLPDGGRVVSLPAGAVEFEIIRTTPSS